METNNNILLRFLELESRRVDYSGLKGHIWKIFAIIGHNFFNKKPPEHKSKLKLLNLGAGSVRLDGFINADFYRLHSIFHKSKPDWMLDLTKPLNCESNYWDGILMEHVNEHLLYSQNYRLFKELFRTLGSGGILRIVVPDLDRYLNWPSLVKIVPKMARYKTMPEAISNLTQNHAHVSTWNVELLTEVLIDIGFTEVESTEFREGGLLELLKDSENHQWQSLYLEARKP